MLEKRATTNGKIFTDIGNLKVWDKNPRSIENPEDFQRLLRQLAYLGQYKPNLVTEDGITVGGNQRLKGMNWLNVNVLTWTDSKGVAQEVDRRGQFNEIWITELAFGKVEETGKYKAIIDGKTQEREYDSVEQIMIEYALSDNDPVGMYDQQALHDLTQPYQELILAGTYKLEVAPSISLESFNAEFKIPGKTDPAKNKEVTADGVGKELDVTCPKCGFHFKGDTDEIETVNEDEDEPAAQNGEQPQA